MKNKKRLYAIYNGPRTRDPMENSILERLESEKILEVGEIYVVNNVDMSQSGTYITLQGVGSKNLNSVSFDFFVMHKGKLCDHDIYNDPAYNPYLGFFK